MRRFLKSKWTISIVIELVVASLITLFMVHYQERTDTYGWLSGLQISGAFIFLFGFVVLISNEGFFDFASYGVKSFFMGIAGKKPEKSLFEIRQQKVKISSVIQLTLWIIGGLIIIVSYILFAVLL